MLNGNEKIQDQELGRISLKHLMALLQQEIYWCEKACGCGTCFESLLNEYFVDDNGAVLK